MRWRVAWHQYHMLLGVTNLRRELSMPPCNETDNPPPPHTGNGDTVVFKVKST